MIESTKAVEGITSILSNFDDEELFNLASTVTQGLLKKKLETRKGAVEAILKYSTSVESFVRRKVVTREHLFRYLDENDVEIRLPTTKEKLIDKTLALWCETLLPVAVPTLPVAVPTSEAPKLELDVMSKKFAEWYYGMVNQSCRLGTEHFFADASLDTRVHNGEEILTNRVEGNVADVVELLFQLKQTYNLYFNPNLGSDGTNGKMDPHGLVLVLTCGTLHVNDAVAGVFEQIFGLARDPFADNNWKIKNTKLILRSEATVAGAPKLCDGDLTTRLEITEV